MNNDWHSLTVDILVWNHSNQDSIVSEMLCIIIIFVIVNMIQARHIYMDNEYNIYKTECCGFRAQF